MSHTLLFRNSINTVRVSSNRRIKGQPRCRWKARETYFRLILTTVCPRTRIPRLASPRLASLVAPCGPTQKGFGVVERAASERTNLWEESWVRRRGQARRRSPQDESASRELSIGALIGRVGREGRVVEVLVLWLLIEEDDGGGDREEGRGGEGGSRCGG